MIKKKKHCSSLNSFHRVITKNGEKKERNKQAIIVLLLSTAECHFLIVNIQGLDSPVHIHLIFICRTKL